MPPSSQALVRQRPRRRARMKPELCGLPHRGDSTRTLPGTLWTPARGGSWCPPGLGTGLTPGFAAGDRAGGGAMLFVRPGACSWAPLVHTGASVNCSLLYSSLANKPCSWWLPQRRFKHARKIGFRGCLWARPLLPRADPWYLRDPALLSGH